MSAILAEDSLEACRIEPHASIWDDTINPHKDAYPVLKPMEMRPEVREWFEREMSSTDLTVNRSGSQGGGIIYGLEGVGDDHGN